jgi:uncharacterized protein
MKRPRIPLPTIRALESIYDSLPTVECKGLCDSFCGPILLSHAEDERIRLRTGKPVGISRDNKCDKLKDGQCTVYDLRPLVCRIWGSNPIGTEATAMLHCPHGCKVSRAITEREVMLLTRDVLQVGGGFAQNAKAVLRGLSEAAAQGRLFTRREESE